MEPEKKTNILLVDDNPAKLLALESALLKLNLNLVTATSGREALRALLTQNFEAAHAQGWDNLDVTALARLLEASQA